MKKIIALAIVAGGFMFASCGTQQADNEQLMPGTMRLDLTDKGKPVSMVVPDSTIGRMEVLEQSEGSVEIMVGEAFQVSIQEASGEDLDLKLQKSFIEGNEINKVQRYLTDDATTLLYESKITDPEFHFYTLVKVGNDTYVVKDIEGARFTEAQAKAMLEAAKTLKPSSKVATPEA